MPRHPARITLPIASLCLMGIGLLSPVALAGQVHDIQGPPRLPTQAVQVSEYFNLDQASKLMSAREYRQALPHLRQAVEKNPTNLFALYNLGYSYFELAKQVEGEEQAAMLDEAELAFQRVQSLNPELTVTYFKLGKIALMRERFEDAMHYYREGLAVDPENSALLFNLAGVHDQRNEMDQALMYYQRAIEKDPSFTFAYNNLGLLYEKLGRRADAEKTYKRALKHDPKYNLARLNLGTLYAEQGRFHEAQSLYEKALMIEPDNAWAHLYLGNILFREGRYEQAAKEYQASVENNPNYPTAYYLLAITLAKLQRTDEALSAGLNYISLAPDGHFAQEMKTLVLSIKLQRAGGFRLLEETTPSKAIPAASP